MHKTMNSKIAKHYIYNVLKHLKIIMLENIEWGFYNDYKKREYFI